MKELSSADTSCGAGRILAWLSVGRGKSRTISILELGEHTGVCVCVLINESYSCEERRPQSEGLGMWPRSF